MKNTYDKTIGYSPLEDVDRTKMRHVIQVNKKIINKYFLGKPVGRILVAGAGQGDEAELIFDEYHTSTVGVDINIVKRKDSIYQQDISFCKQNLEHLAFANHSFSLIYCYHVLEHVSNPLATLRELYRVLEPGGQLFIGFPNKNRLFSYIGTSQKVSLIEKIRWNYNDYVYRFKGRFENKYGAHAGFVDAEFAIEARNIFKMVIPVRNEYMLIKYFRMEKLIRVIIGMGLGEILFPSNYYVCLR